MAIDTAKIKAALPKESGLGRRSVIRNRPDVHDVVLDVVLKRRTLTDIAKRCGVTTASLDRFRSKFITPEVQKLCLVMDQEQAANALDEKVNEGQDEIQNGLRLVIKEQREIYALIKAKIGEGRDIEDLAPALAQLLRDMGQSLDRLTKAYSALQAKTTIITPIQESPEWAKLSDVLFSTFQAYPEAFAAFQALAKEKRLRLG
ncbi:hypothetical protein LX70_00555 [Defluviimonas denitrificans]|uniref:Uncharacterized protein n=1 Tax=Albidovulum denitrificans TaxID=404881 RepID=A0A2S8SDD0_9RHOB|nr:hypothetical protein [Defluviimonas denitrificans]PQV58742.1 hypothetical protein LX70_00555 [Defluviimonas denitrificans]